MQTRTLIGRLLKSDGTPYEGVLEFLPEKEFWVHEEGVDVALLAPACWLEDGRFVAEVDVGSYIVNTPIGRWRINVQASENHIGFLSDYLPQRYT